MVLSLNLPYSEEHGMNKCPLKHHVCIYAALECKHTRTYLNVGSIVVYVLFFVIVYYYIFIFNMCNVNRYDKAI